MVKKLAKNEAKEFTKPILTVLNEVGEGFIVLENCGRGLGYYVRPHAEAAWSGRRKLTQSMFDKMIECGMIECDETQGQPWCVDFYKLSDKSHQHII